MSDPRLGLFTSFLIQLEFKLIGFTVMNSMKRDHKDLFHFVLNDTKKFRGNWSLNIVQ